MISALRDRFNANFTVAGYERFLRALDEETRTRIEFRPCETPVFIPTDLLREMIDGALSLTGQLDTPAYRDYSGQVTPPEFRSPNEGLRPQFVQVDFALTRQEDGRIVPRLIELQGLASLYAYQLVLARTYCDCYKIDGVDYLPGGMKDERYLDLLRETVVAGHDPREVILLDVAPEGQKTLPDFRATEALLGVAPVCVSRVTRRGGRLWYRRDGREVRIRRICNRIVPEELSARGLRPDFAFSDDLDVEWATAVSWYFRWSKFALPYLSHSCVPRSLLLSDWRGEPDDPAKFVLKPLFSFGGAGVKLDVTAAEIEAIPAAERSGWLMQEKVEYAPLIRTPDGERRVEVRIMLLWPEAAATPTPVTVMARLSRGRMIGVSRNQDGGGVTWVGSSCGLFPHEGTVDGHFPGETC